MENASALSAGIGRAFGSMPSIRAVSAPWEAPGSQVLSELQAVLVCAGFRVDFTASGRERQMVLAAGDAPTEDEEQEREGAARTAQVLTTRCSGPAGEWRLLLARPERGFDEKEVALASVLLHDWCYRLAQPRELWMGRMLVTGDLQVVLADLVIQAWSVERAAAVKAALDRVRTLLAVRFAEVTDQVRYELMVGAAEAPIWAKLWFWSTGSSPKERLGCLELRVLAAGEVPVLGDVTDERIAKAIGYIDCNYGRSPALVEMAKSAYMSPFHFHRTFTDHTKISPKQYVVARQIQAARWLLRATEVPIAQVAQRCGFSSHGHFSTAFHRLTGFKPSAYREQERYASWSDASNSGDERSVTGVGKDVDFLR
jgi:AraC-like DNA-binding protein